MLSRFTIGSTTEVLATYPLDIPQKNFKVWIHNFCTCMGYSVYNYFTLENGGTAAWLRGGDDKLYLCSIEPR